MSDAGEAHRSDCCLGLRSCNTRRGSGSATAATLAAASPPPSDFRQNRWRTVAAPSASSRRRAAAAKSAACCRRNSCRTRCPRTSACNCTAALLNKRYRRSAIQPKAQAVNFDAAKRRRASSNHVKATERMKTFVFPTQISCSPTPAAFMTSHTARHVVEASLSGSFAIAARFAGAVELWAPAEAAAEARSTGAYLHAKAAKLRRCA
mmetsp:Transcript_78760/g.200470  ORF Transcript_78760/g.200470 Transcript_78760/m.200470 type:complete len:207 (+) Transcript_78760:797-1417(+)